MKKVTRPAQKNINFRQSASDRSATASYRNFGTHFKNFSKFVKGQYSKNFTGGKNVQS